MTTSSYSALIRDNLKAAFETEKDELALRLDAEIAGDKLVFNALRPDEDFAANLTCLFAANAHRFLPTDALADVGEYTSRAMIAALA